jgi:hypothetical protein
MGHDYWASEFREKYKAPKHNSKYNLNSEIFYEQYQVKNRWLRLQESI